MSVDTQNLPKVLPRIRYRVTHEPGVFPRAATIAVVSAVALGLGFAAVESGRYTLAGCAGLAIGAILLRSPAMGVLAVLVVAATLGDEGAHLLIGGVPLMELLVVLASLAAVARAIVRRQEILRRETLLWTIPALWGVSQLLFRNRGDTISGLREALIFIYPLLFALPLMGVSAVRMRVWLLQYGRYICLLGWLVLGIGLYNQATGHLSITSTGQARALSSWYSEPLVAAFLISLWLYQEGRLRLFPTLLLATPLTGLLLVNHRSAYLGAIIAIFFLTLLRRGPRKLQTRGLGKLALIFVVVATIVVVATPAGRAGVARFLTITATNDPNINNRLERDQNAVPTTNTGWAIGDGVGLEHSTVTGETKFGAAADPNQTHNSFATMLHLGGLIGLATIMVPFLLITIKSIPVRGDPLVQVLAAFIVYTVIMAFFNVVLENSYFGAWLWAALLPLQAIVVSRARNPEVVVNAKLEPSKQQVRRQSHDV